MGTSIYSVFYIHNYFILIYSKFPFLFGKLAFLCRKFEILQLIYGLGFHAHQMHTKHLWNLLEKKMLSFPNYCVPTLCQSILMVVEWKRLTNSTEKGTCLCVRYMEKHDMLGNLTGTGKLLSPNLRQHYGAW